VHEIVSKLQEAGFPTRVLSSHSGAEGE
jgi:phage replication-related protein YjqB (UPF0714/DUF867 family)